MGIESSGIYFIIDCREQEMQETRDGVLKLFYNEIIRRIIDIRLEWTESGRPISDVSQNVIYVFTNFLTWQCWPCQAGQRRQLGGGRSCA